VRLPLFSTITTITTTSKWRSETNRIETKPIDSHLHAPSCAIVVHTPCLVRVVPLVHPSIHVPAPPVATNPAAALQVETSKTRLDGWLRESRNDKVER
jgi:hypothetical protein